MAESEVKEPTLDEKLSSAAASAVEQMKARAAEKAAAKASEDAMPEDDAEATETEAEGDIPADHAQESAGKGKVEETTETERKVETVGAEDAEVEKALALSESLEAGLDAEAIKALGPEKTQRYLRALMRDMALTAAEEKPEPKDEPKAEPKKADAEPPKEDAGDEDPLKAKAAKIDPEVETPETMELLKALVDEVFHQRKKLAALEHSATERGEDIRMRATETVRAATAAFDATLNALGPDYVPIFGKGEINDFALLGEDGKLAAKSGKESQWQARTELADAVKEITLAFVREKLPSPPLGKMVEMALKRTGFQRMVEADSKARKVTEALVRDKRRATTRPSHVAEPADPGARRRAVAERLAAVNAGAEA